jgi:septal ring factor EnvC (AmiA/AmiB activator)
MHLPTRLPKILFVTLVVFEFLVSPAFSLFDGPVLAGSLEDQLAQLQKDIANIRANKSSLQNNINAQKNQLGVYSGAIGKLRGEMENLQLDIADLDLQIQELQVNIQILEGQIADKQTEIDKNQTLIVTLEVDSNARIQDNYMTYRTHGGISGDFFKVKSADTYFKDSQYKELIQDETNRALEELAQLKAQLAKDKADLDDKVVDVRRKKAVVDEQKASLDRSKQEVETKMNAYYTALNNTKQAIANGQSVLGAYSNEEAKKVAQAEYLKQQIFNSFKPSTSGQYVVAGTQIGRQGMTGWATGPHLHFSLKVNGVVVNPCGYLPGNFVAGCGGNGALKAPMFGNYYFTSGFYSGVGGDVRCIGGVCSSHPAVDFANVISNAPIYAAHDGWLYKGVDQYGALYIIICQNQNCNSGFQTGYWHFSQY